MTHIRTRFLFLQDVMFRKLLNMSAVKTDVSPSDIGLKTPSDAKKFADSELCWIGQRACRNEFGRKLARSAVNQNTALTRREEQLLMANGTGLGQVDVSEQLYDNEPSTWMLLVKDKRSDVEPSTLKLLAEESKYSTTNLF